MNTRTIFIIAATLALAASVWMALTGKAETTPPQPEAHASVRVTIPAATDPPPPIAAGVAEFVQLDREIFGIIDGKPVVIAPGFYRVRKQAAPKISSD